MALFLSNFTNKMVKKGKVSVPSQFRLALSNQDFSGIVVYESFVNQCIEGCDMDRIRQLSESIDNLDPFSEVRDSFATTILGNAVQLNFDSDGRVIIPERLLKIAEIDEKAVLVGKGSTFEIWQNEKFEEYAKKAREQAKNNRDLLSLAKNKSNQ